MIAVLFDLDGTLINSQEGIIRSALYALLECGIEEKNPDRLKAFIGPPLKDSFMNFYHMTDEEASKAVAFYRKRYNVTGLFEAELYPGAAEALQRLRDAGIPTAIASSKPEATCRRILDHFGILPLFDEVAGASFDGRISTKEEVLQELFRRWENVPKKDMYLVGDTMYDVEGAKKAGIGCIAVDYGFGDPRIMKQEADAMCSSLAETVDYLLQMYIKD